MTVLLAACTGAAEGPPAEPEGTFALPAEEQVDCLEHQQEAPGPAYTGGADGDTAAIFAMLRYWTSHGDKPYCDGAPATEVDQQWRDLVVALGATRPPDPPPASADGPASDGPAPDSTGPDSTAPDSTGPDSTGPDGTAPDSTGPDSTSESPAPVST